MNELYQQILGMPGTDAEIVDQLNESIVTLKPNTFVRTRTLLNGLGGISTGEWAGVLVKINGAIKSLSQSTKINDQVMVVILEETLDLMRGQSETAGIDVGVQATRDQIDSMVTAKILTQAQGDALKSHGSETSSIAHQIIQRDAVEIDIQKARLFGESFENYQAAKAVAESKIDGDYNTMISEITAWDGTGDLPKIYGV